MQFLIERHVSHQVHSLNLILIEIGKEWLATTDSDKPLCVRMAGMDESKPHCLRLRYSLRRPFQESILIDALQPRKYFRAILSLIRASFFMGSI